MTLLVERERAQLIPTRLRGKLLKEKLCRSLGGFYGLFNCFPLSGGIRLRVESNEPALLRWSQCGSKKQDLSSNLMRNV